MASELHYHVYLSIYYYFKTFKILGSFGKITISPLLLTVSDFFWHQNKGLALSYILKQKIEIISHFTCYM